jgi:hypothetical protein
MEFERNCASCHASLLASLAEERVFELYGWVVSELGDDE